MPLSEPHDWRMTLAFCAAVVLLVLGLKLISAWRRPAPRGFWLTLLPSSASMRRARAARAGDGWRVVGRCALALTGFVAGWWCYWRVVEVTGAPGVWLGWLGAPLVWAMGQAVSALAQLLWLPSGRLMPAVHGNVFAARSVADFWGRRWNLWMSDWFRQVIFTPLRGRPAMGVTLAFAVSGFIHELVLNLVLWLVTGRNLFGSMMAYYGIQAAGVLVERRLPGGRAGWRRAFAWLVVLGPVPWMVNEGLLRALHLWPGN